MLSVCGIVCIKLCSVYIFSQNAILNFVLQEAL